MEIKLFDVNQYDIIYDLQYAEFMVKLLEKYPENANLQNILGVALQRLGKFKFSIDAFKKAIYLNIPSLN